MFRPTMGTFRGLVINTQMSNKKRNHSYKDITISPKMVICRPKHAGVSFVYKLLFFVVVQLLEYIL